MTTIEYIEREVLDKNGNKRLHIGQPDPDSEEIIYTERELVKNGKKQYITKYKVQIVDERDFVETPHQHKTTEYMTLYEYATLLDARALQLGAPNSVPQVPLVNPEDYNPINIAKREIELKLVSLVVRRHLPDGSTDDWHVRDMVLPKL